MNLIKSLKPWKVDDEAKGKAKAVWGRFLD